MNNFYTLRESIFFFIFSFLTINAFSQVGIGTTNPNSNALLEIDASTTPGGLLLPRVNLVATNNVAPLSAHIPGMAVYNNATTSGAYGVSPGYYFNDGGRWVRIAATSDASDDWKLTGNIGTTPGTGTNQNYLGTRDNRAMIIASNNSERLRVLANGQVSVNATTPLAGDRFTVQGAANEYAINGLTSGGSGSGVYGENATTNGIGIFGNAAVGFGVLGQSTGGGQGVTGVNTGAAGVGVYGNNTSSGIGVLGNNNYNGAGVQGQNNGTGDGVLGFAAGPGDGVYGQNSGNGNGVYGISNNSSGLGVRAYNLSGIGTGLLATGNGVVGATLNSGTGISSVGIDGVFAYGRNVTGTGVMGTGNNSTSIISSINGGGVAGSGTRNGVFGYSGNGALNNGNRGNAAGIFLLDTDNNIGNNNGLNDNGIRATAILAGFDNIAFNDNNGTAYPAADSYFGGYFSGGTQRTGFPTAYAYVGLRYNTAANGRSGTDFKIVGTGLVSTLINDDQNVPRIMFAPESPEIVFQDYGVGQLVNGQAHISIDPILKQSLHIDSNHPLKVFVTLEGDCNGVFVTNKSADGFTVKELQNGTSNVPFSWQIVANRADTKDRSGNVVSKHVGLRLPVGPGPINAEAKQLELKTVDKKESLKKPMESGLINEVKRELSSTGEVNNQSAESNLQSNTLEESSTSPTTESEVSKTKE